MADVTIIGIDLASRVFSFTACGADGTMVFRRKLNRGKVLRFLALHEQVVRRPAVAWDQARIQEVRVECYLQHGAFSSSRCLAVCGETPRRTESGEAPG